MASSLRARRAAFFVRRAAFIVRCGAWGVPLNWPEERLCWFGIQGGGGFNSSPNGRVQRRAAMRAQPGPVPVEFGMVPNRLCSL